MPSERSTPPSLRTSTSTLTAPGYLGPGGVFEAGYRYRADGGVDEQTTVSLWKLEVPLDPVQLVVYQWHQLVEGSFVSLSPAAQE